MPRDPNACEYRAVHEPDADGLCRHCFKPVRSTLVPRNQQRLRVMVALQTHGALVALYDLHGREPGQGIGYARALVAPGDIIFGAGSNFIVDFRRPVVFGTPLQPWGPISHLGLFALLDAGLTEIAREPLPVPVVVGGPGGCAPIIAPGHTKFHVHLGEPNE